MDSIENVFDAVTDINKIMLKSIVDETSLGKYDFMYLRIGTCTTELWPVHVNNGVLC